jgi:RNA polymerase sigma factor (sigma-70 family)
MAEHATIVVDARSLRAMSFFAGRNLDTLEDRVMHTARIGGTTMPHDEQTRLFLRLRDLRSRVETLSDHGTDEDRRRLLDEINDIRHRLVVGNIGLACAVVQRLAPPHRRDELCSIAFATLLRAIDHFDPTRGVCFSTYATTSILNHVRQALALAVRNDVRCRSTDPLLLADIPDTRTDASTLFDASLARLIVHRLLDRLDDRSRFIVTRYFGIVSPRLTIIDLARLMKVSPQRISQILYRALARLRAACPA